MLVSLGPVIAEGVSQIVPISIKGGAWDGGSEVGGGLQPLLAVLVPKVDVAVGAGGGKGPVDRVEADGVHGKGVIPFAVALECKIVANAS